MGERRQRLVSPPWTGASASWDTRETKPGRAPQENNFLAFSYIWKCPFCFSYFKIHSQQNQRPNGSVMPPRCCATLEEVLWSEAPRSCRDRSNPPSSIPFLPHRHHLITVWYLASSITGSSSSICQLREALLHLSLSPRLSHLPPRHRSCTSQNTLCKATKQALSQHESYSS